MYKKTLPLLVTMIIVIATFIMVMAETSYTDVADNASYAEAVEYCIKNGLMVGTSDTEFSPDENTSRAMLVTILHRSEGTPTAEGTLSFADVENGAWYYDAVRWAANTGIVEGYDTRTFGPADFLTREQIISILWRLDGEEEAENITLPYDDIGSVSKYAQSAVRWAYEAGIIDDEGTMLVPQGNVTRSDMAVMLYRYINKVKETPTLTPTFEPDDAEKPEESAHPNSVIPDVHVRFGRTEFDVVLYDTTTKELLMSQLSSREMMLPESYDMGGVCKYYDIPSRYLSYMGIVTEEITEVQAGDMLIGKDGRLFLYYEDTEITGDYMRVGYIKDMTGIAEELGDGSITFYVSEYIDSEENSESVSSNAIPLTSSITQFANDFSAVRFEGDDYLDEFLTQNGASSDAEVIRFLQNRIGEDAAELGLEIGGFACSTLAADGENGGKLFGRNFDWSTCDALITVSHPTNGYASIATVNTDFIKTVYSEGFDSLPDSVRTLVSLYAPLDGMNEMGLCAAMLMIQDGDTVNQNTQKSDITTTTAIRMLLNNAATTDEAIEMLRQYDFHSSFGMMLHFAISDANGKSVAVEYVNDEMIVTETPILTNFYVSEGEKKGIGTAQSHTRFEMLQDTLAQNSTMTMNTMRDAMENVSKKNFSDGTTTEWSIVYDKSNSMANYYHREDFDTVYTFEI